MRDYEEEDYYEFDCFWVFTKQDPENETNQIYVGSVDANEIGPRCSYNELMTLAKSAGIIQNTKEWQQVHEELYPSSYRRLCNGKDTFLDVSFVELDDEDIVKIADIDEPFSVCAKLDPSRSLGEGTLCVNFGVDLGPDGFYVSCDMEGDTFVEGIYTDEGPFGSFKEAAWKGVNIACEYLGNAETRGSWSFHTDLKILLGVDLNDDSE